MAGAFTNDLHLVSWSGRRCCPNWKKSSLTSNLLIGPIDVSRCGRRGRKGAIRVLQLRTIMTTIVTRLRGCQPDVEVWQRILQVRALVLSARDDSVTWIKFANLCRKSDRMFLVDKTIESLMTPVSCLQHPKRHTLTFLGRARHSISNMQPRRFLRTSSMPILNFCGPLDRAMSVYGTLMTSRKI